MKLLLVAFFFLANAAAASGLRLAQSPLPADSDASTHYVGTVSIAGSYYEDEAGDLCFEPSPASTRRLLVVPPRAKVCFSDQENAEALLGIAAAVRRINTTSICGIRGSASLIVTGLWVGTGPANTWYTTKLARIVKREPPTFLRCGG